MTAENNSDKIKKSAMTENAGDSCTEREAEAESFLS